MKILAALDGSPAAYHALESACLMARRLRWYVAAIYVNKGWEYTPEEAGWASLREKLAAELESLGTEVLRRAGAIGSGCGVPIEGVVADGIPAEEIVRYVESHGIVKLIAMGHSSKGRGTQEFAESTTKAVVTRARNTPVFITSVAREVDSVLVAVDDSPAAQRALAAVAPLALGLEVPVRVVTVIPDAEALLNEYRRIAEIPRLERYVDQMRAGLERKAHQLVEEAGRQLAARGLSVSVQVLEGNPRDVIAAQARSAGLTAVGIRRRAEQSVVGKVLGKMLGLPDVSLLCVQ